MRIASDCTGCQSTTQVATLQVTRACTCVCDTPISVHTISKVLWWAFSFFTFCTAGCAGRWAHQIHSHAVVHVTVHTGTGGVAGRAARLLYSGGDNPTVRRNADAVTDAHDKMCHKKSSTAALPHSDKYCVTYIL